jgi:hypothetical protein
MVCPRLTRCILSAADTTPRDRPTRPALSFAGAESGPPPGTCAPERRLNFPG